MPSSHPGLVPVTLDSLGAGIARISHNKSGLYWRIVQVAVLTVPSQPIRIVTTFNDQPVLSPVTVLSGAAADGEPPIDLGDHDTMKFVLTNGPPGGQAVISYYYTELPTEF